jgi:hypothetical protein
MKYQVAIPTSLALIVMTIGCGTNQTVVFMGDSITYIWGAAVRQPRLSTASVVDRCGRPRQHFGANGSRFQEDVMARLPSVVAILAGTNDGMMSIRAGHYAVPVDPLTPATTLYGWSHKRSLKVFDRFSLLLRRGGAKRLYALLQNLPIPIRGDTNA